MGNHFIASLHSTSSRFGDGEGNRFIASLRSALSQFGEGEGNRFIASLRSASSRFGDGEGELLHCFTPFRFIAIWGWGWGIASLLHSVPLYRDLGLGLGITSLLHSVPLYRDLGGEGNRFIASLRSALSRFGEGELLKPSPGNQVQSYPHMEAVMESVTGTIKSQKETSPLDC